MDMFVHCVLLFHLLLSTIITTKADTDSLLGERKTWFKRGPIKSMVKPSGKCQFRLKLTDSSKFPMQLFEIRSDELNSLVERGDGAEDTLYLHNQLKYFVYLGVPGCFARIIIDENATYKLEKLVLTRLPQLPANTDRLQSLKQFTCNEIYSALIDIAVLTGMMQLEFFSLYRSFGVTIAHSLHLPVLKRLTIENTPMMFLNDVVWDFPELTKLQLRNCSLEAIPSYFSTFGKLTQIEILHNKLQNITFDIFSGMDQLVRLILALNKVSEITTQKTVDLPGLISLDLSDNNLTVLNVTLWITPSLKQLMLANNQLKQVPGLLTLFRGKVERLLLRDNPWDCGWLNHTVGIITDVEKVASKTDFCDVEKAIKSTN